MIPVRARIQPSYYGFLSDVIDICHQPKLKKCVNMFMIPTHTGQPHFGVSSGSRFIHSWMVNNLKYSVNLHDRGFFLNCPVKHHQTFDNITRIGQSDTNLYIGGDHSISVSSGLSFLEMNQYSNPGVIWVDTHTDINTKATSKSNNLHGMSVAYMMGLEREPWFKDRIKNYLKPNNIVYIGSEDIDEPEHKIIQELGIKMFTRSDVRNYGMAQVFEWASDYLYHCEKLHVSIDVDVTNDIIGTGTRVPGGMNYHDFFSLACEISLNDTVNSIDIVEFNPDFTSCVEEELDMIGNFISVAIGNNKD